MKSLTIKGAFDLGFEAGFEGNCPENPYPTGTQRWQAFEEGVAEAHTEWEEGQEEFGETDCPFWEG